MYGNGCAEVASEESKRISPVFLIDNEHRPTSSHARMQNLMSVLSQNNNDDVEDNDSTSKHVKPELKPESDESIDLDADATTEEFKKSMWAGKSSILVAVRLRPQCSHDRDQGSIVKVLENKVVVVLDPGMKKDVVGKMRKRNREKRYAFDYVFSPKDGQEKVYQNTTKFLIDGILDGFNATVFAYGCTGAGKTYTMLGTQDAPGIMALTLEDLFNNIESIHEDSSSDISYTATVSFLEVYNENIRDLLAPSSNDYLDLREDPIKGATVVGINEIPAFNAKDVMKLLRRGNKNRSQEATAANAVSSRSHAVLQVVVEQKNRTPGIVSAFKAGKLSMIDLAGSERAAVTKNRGARLMEGANINRSLLALGNCINALGEKANRASFVPYRDSKLTRLLKDSLGGNCRTVMIANISMSVSCMEETMNTLKYANRAKNIKTTVTRNVHSVSHHISEYSSVIDNLRTEISRLKTQLAQQDGDCGLNAEILYTTHNKEITMQDARNCMTDNFEKRKQLQGCIMEIEKENIILHNTIQHQQNLINEIEEISSDTEANSTDRVSSMSDLLYDGLMEASHDDVRVEIEVKNNLKPRNAANHIKAMKQKVHVVEKKLDENSKKEVQLLSILKHNEEIGEEFRSILEKMVAIPNRRDLILLEYRIGTLELEKLVLEKKKMITTAISDGKEHKIQKLMRKLEIQDKIIKSQQDLLDKVNKNEKMEVHEDLLITDADPEKKEVKVENMDELEVRSNEIESNRDTDLSSVHLPEIQVLSNSKSRTVVPEEEIDLTNKKSNFLKLPNSFRQKIRTRQESQSEWLSQRNDNTLPYIVLKKKSMSFPTTPYLKALKKRRQERKTLKDSLTM